ncbi:ribonuclease H-like domain-containing protein [Collybia nuda]|uniref:ribonuclease H n=1 Tax=Collybia nuda TaxID=64659 RepID=A0A9P5YEX0_9AGAR|nr:ribonuclease H-like domain-containing protein [Collybia nuda]
MTTPIEYKEFSMGPEVALLKIEVSPHLYTDGPIRSIKSTIGPPIQVAPRSRRFTLGEDTNVKPLDIFKPMINACSVPAPRWIYFDPSTHKASILIFVDGAAPNNGTSSVTAGCGVVFRPDGKGCISFPLERTKGINPTNNRAEIRAAHAAFGLRYWSGEGFQRVVIATDSEYLVRGISEYVLIWKENGWMTVEGKPVKNQDLWKLLLEDVESYEKRGVQVQFWLIPRELNHFADVEAKKGAKQTENIPTEIKKIVFFDISLKGRNIMHARDFETG